MQSSEVTDKVQFAQKLQRIVLENAFNKLKDFLKR